ncbi:MAG: GNAT family N-acetyltransferase [Anaerolineaceae bacterium]
MVIQVFPLQKESAINLGNKLISLNENEWENWTIENLLVNRKHKWDLSYYVTVNENLAGYAIASIIDENTVHIHHIIMCSDYRNMGIGRKLINEISNKAITYNATKMTLKVHKHNFRAINFYRKLGFTFVELENPDYFKMIVHINSITTEL